MKNKPKFKLDKNGKKISLSSQACAKNDYGAMLKHEDYATVRDYLIARGI